MGIYHESAEETRAAVAVAVGEPPWMGRLREKPIIPEGWRLLECGEMREDNDYFVDSNLKGASWKACRARVGAGHRIEEHWSPTIRRVSREASQASLWSR